MQPAAPETATPQGADELFEAVYARLKAMAARELDKRGHATLNTTALLHDVYLRIGKQAQLRFEHPAQFFAYAARAMRHLLADRARDRLRLRAGGDLSRVTLTGSDMQLAIDSAEQALGLDAALDRLAETDVRAAQAIELHYFGGLTVAQIAQHLDLATATIDRDLRFARAFLKDALAN